MGRENNNIGRLGEGIALEFLKKKGYEILEVNLRTPFGELDAVARKKDFIIFVETKTRTGDSLGPPCLSVTKTKQIQIVRNALAYLKRHGLTESNWRVDVVSVKLDYRCEIESVEIIENAVEGYL